MINRRKWINQSHSSCERVQNLWHGFWGRTSFPLCCIFPRDAKSQNPSVRCRYCHGKCSDERHCLVALLRMHTVRECYVESPFFFLLTQHFFPELPIIRTDSHDLVSVNTNIKSSQAKSDSLSNILILVISFIHNTSSFIVSNW